MTTITAQKRDMKVKAKKLRRDGFIPGILCGHEIKEAVTIQIPEKEAMKLIRENQKGEQVELFIGDKKVNAIIKDFYFNAMKRQIEVIDFQALVKGEKINTSVDVVLKNEMMAKGSVTQELSQINYKADPEHLLDTVVIDFEKINGVRHMKVSDLDIFKDPNIVVANPDAMIFSVSYDTSSAEVETAAETSEAAE